MPVLKVISDERVPIKIWSADVEPQAIEQLRNTAKLPFVFKHVAVMPDVHLGHGATIGSVVATRGAISPACVGVDIGCGMMAVKTGLDHKLVREKLPALRHSIERSIPTGDYANNRLTDSVSAWNGWANWIHLSSGLVDGKLYRRAQDQLGSLGGGNHFVEICLDTENAVWVMLHSGSRGVGNTLARRHIETAKDLMKKMFIDLPDPDLAYLVQDTPEFDSYMRDLNWAQEYAAQNRVEMMNRVLKDLAHMFNNKQPLDKLIEVNCHHNYVAQENHFGTNVLVTRKGAVRARLGDMGIIPGSMGDKSYIVSGNGNVESFHSCSHGAGRLMSRTKARAAFTLEDIAKQTEGVECRKDLAIADEAPKAYKPIADVMANQTDLVTVVAELKQILCVKG